MKSLSARDDGGASLSGGLDLIETAAQSGLVECLLSMLSSMQAIQHPRAAERGELVPEKEQETSFPRKPVYLGYRSDVVAGTERSGAL